MSSNQKQIYYRLIALWVICEAMLGGIIHGFKLPVSGLIIGGSAVVCISLIGYFVPKKGAIIRATIVVAIFKMLLSPHSPFPAYIAVLFQGICGEIIFSTGNKNFALKGYVLAFLTLIESAFQRVLVMTILFGVDFWKAVNDFISNLTRSEPSTNYSLYFISIYVFLHLAAAFFIGKFIANIPHYLRYKKEEIDIYRIDTTGTITTEPEIPKKKKINFLFIIWILLAGIFLYAQVYPDGIFKSSHPSLKFIFRSAIILLSWYLIVAPFLMNIFRKWLDKKKDSYKKEIEEVILLLPSTKILIRESWKRSSGQSGFARIKLFWKYLIINTVV